uniref:Uncharacterized protein n=1 Tax=Anguilla anguilla TaxID=7936 RepID=A0A0E9PT52_ANGAN
MLLVRDVNKACDFCQHVYY